MTLRLLLKLVIIQLSGSTIFAQVGESCISKRTSQEGVCKIESQCPFVINQAKLGIKATLCGFHELVIPIVCCPDSNGRSITTMRISEQKCELYSTPITRKFSLITLDANPETLTVITDNCTYNRVPLIVGGEPAELGEFPFMALVGFNTTESPWKCGGTLISERYVLTAAHCTFSSDSLISSVPTKVRLGELDLSSDNDGSQHMDYRVSSIIVYPDYNWPQVYNDIALLRLQTRVVFTRFIRPACLANSRFLKTGKPLATGWGKTGFNDPYSDKLLKVSLEIFDNAICNRSYSNEEKLPNGIISSMLCVGEPRNSTDRKDTCEGDSGGPLIVARESNLCQFYVIGITSLGKACGVSKIPAIYTRVSEYVSWIEEQIW
ncbi:unnamed protein product [Phaedon cochleariae]|uniref:Peptidase S1 domain-containing protein n=1 Tax=Phaedon cochleariae TaxID=80249 RepID=A0A9P0DL45_PHACE|nr:unnamed protein product [Phaedon cochleariae]